MRQTPRGSALTASLDATGSALQCCWRKGQHAAAAESVGAMLCQQACTHRRTQRTHARISVEGARRVLVMFLPRPHHEK